MDQSDKEFALHIKKATITGGTVNNGNWVPDGEWLKVPHSPEGYKRDGFILGDRPQNINAMQASPAEKCAYTTVQFAEPLGDLQNELGRLTNQPALVRICMYERDENDPVKLHTGEWFWWVEVLSVDPMSMTLKVYVAREAESKRQPGGGRTTVTANIDFGNQNAATTSPHGRVNNATPEDLPDMNPNAEEWSTNHGLIG